MQRLKGKLYRITSYLIQIVNSLDLEKERHSDMYVPQLVFSIPLM